MKKFLFLIVFILLTLSIFLLQIQFAERKNKDKPVLSSIMSVTVNGEKFNFDTKSDFYLYSENFDINFESIKTEQDIYVFAGANDEYVNKYSLPIKCDDTEIFPGGAALAENPLDESKGYSLSVNSPYSFHYISSDRRINTQDGAVIPVRNITDPFACFNGNLYISFFVDFNGNNIIEENEYAVLQFHFPLYGMETTLDFSAGKRGYFSTLGFGMLKTMRKYTGSEFKVYKISTHSDFEKMCEIENKNLENTTMEEMFLHTCDEKNLTDINYYVCFIPSQFNQIGNCFRLKGSKSIYLEYVPDTDDAERKVNVRYFSLPKTEVDPVIEFYGNGTLLKGIIN